tara:strand:+ start:1356 stop:1745 length:390 start_codon:yes stop_codon:yes gene_type:complete
MRDKQHAEIKRNSLTLSELPNLNPIKMKAKYYYIDYSSETKTYDVIDCTDPVDQPIVGSFAYEENAIKFHQKLRRNEVWKRMISKMSTEEIQTRCILVTASQKQGLGDSEENDTFYNLLNHEYHLRLED